MQGFDRKATSFNLAVVLYDIVREGQHDLIFQLAGQIFRVQLFANVADRRQRGQSDLLVLVACVVAEVCNKFTPLAARNLDLGDRCD